MGRRGATSALLPTTFSRLDAYPDSAAKCVVDPNDPPVLRDLVKTSGQANFNQRRYQDVWAESLAASLTVLHRQPTAYLRGVGNAFALAFQPAKKVKAEEPNSVALSRYVDVWNAGPLATVDIKLPFALPDQDAHDNWIDGVDFPIELSLTLILATAATLALLPAAAVRWRRFGPSTARVTLVFMSDTVWWTMVVGNLAELSENNRIRYVVEPLVIIATAFAVDRLVRLTLERRRASATSIEGRDAFLD